MNTSQNKITLVTGLWNIKRDQLKEGWSRSYNLYLENFKKLLQIDYNLIIFGDQELYDLTFSIRDTTNTQFIFREKEWFKNEFFDKIQEIRISPEWRNQSSWLKDSTQAQLEMYNPLVMSKMFLLNDARVFDKFDSDYLFWIDGGIANTVNLSYITNYNVLVKIPSLIDRFMFIAFPYKAEKEIHGFSYPEINKFAGKDIAKVGRGGFFGGPKDYISDINGIYYSLLRETLKQNFMGTEESIFSIMMYNNPDLVGYFEIEENGMINTFFEQLKTLTAVFKNEEKSLKKKKIVTKNDLKKIKTNLYILTFNFPEQLKFTLSLFRKTPEWLTSPNLILLDNSTDSQAKILNKEIAKDFNFEYVDLGTNIGICGGRQAAADHFHDSNADYMFFFEDDMSVAGKDLQGNFCRNGFRLYVENLYELLHRIMIKENFDFLKLSFTEVYWDNNIQTAWYNVPQRVREEFWPEYSTIPSTVPDPNAPRTLFQNIDREGNLSYISGEVYYSNWPMIVSKEGNKKMFIDTKWEHPYEQTWMSFAFQEIKKGTLKPGILLASPIVHNRIHYYKPEERREN